MTNRVKTRVQLSIAHQNMIYLYFFFFPPGTEGQWRLTGGLSAVNSVDEAPGMICFHLLSIQAGRARRRLKSDESLSRIL